MAMIVEWYWCHKRANVGGGDRKEFRDSDSCRWNPWRPIDGIRLSAEQNCDPIAVSDEGKVVAGKVLTLPRWGKDLPELTIHR